MKKNKAHKTKPNEDLFKSKYSFLIFVLIFAVIGVLLLVKSLAANTNMSFEPEKGTLATNTTKGSDANASGGSYVQFNKPTSSNPQPIGVGGTWTLKFDDEFSSTNSNTCDKACGLDASKWEMGWVGGSAPVQEQELECYENSNVQVINGYLRLFAVDPTKLSPPQPKPSCPKGGISTRPYTSGAVDSGPNRFAIKYGFFEARIKIDSDANGNVYNWPAWWITDGATTGYNGEIDILEGLSGNATATVHNPSNAPQIGHVHPLYSGWHTFGVNWQSNGNATAYYDGVAIGTQKFTLTDPQALVLGEQISQPNDYGGPIKVPSEMDIDYVRVWQ